MSVYSELVNESGFDPLAPGPQIEPWQPWTLRGTWEIILGRTDMTVWTLDNARQLKQMLAADLEQTQVIATVDPEQTQVIATVVPESPFFDDWLAIGENREEQ